MIWIIACIIGVVLFLFLGYSLCVVANRADAHLEDKTRYDHIYEDLEK
jgi:hypothetical protein